MVLTKNIKEYCAERKTAIKEEIERDFPNGGPVLAVIQVGNNEASNRYIKNKKKDCEEVGIQFQWYYFSEDISTSELKTEIVDLLPYVDGLIVQMPLPEHIDVEVIKLVIDPARDVDGFHPMSYFPPCTPTGIINYLEYCDFKFSGAHCVVIGRSEIVGKPMAQLLLDKNATVTVCHSKTRNIDLWTRNADLIVCAVGKPKFLNCYSLYMPIVDVGINFDENGKLVGDCFNTESRDVTPVPGGVGLLTRVELLSNTLFAAQLKKNGIKEG